MDNKTALEFKNLVSESSKNEQGRSIGQIEQEKDKNVAHRVRGILYVDGNIPEKYLSWDQKGKVIRCGHRGSLVDISCSNGIIYYNVSIGADSPIATKFKTDQMFEISFKSTDDEMNPSHGLNGVTTLTGVPINSSPLEYAYTIFMSTYAPNSMDKMKGMPFCQPPPSVQDALNGLTRIHPEMNVIHAKKTDAEVQDVFDAAMRKELMIGDNDPLPSYEDMIKKYPEAVERSKKKAYTHDDAPVIVVDKKGIIMNTGKNNTGGLVITTSGIDVKGEQTNARKPAVPMDIVGFPSKDLPILDLIPKGNLFTIHPNRLPTLDEILTLGLTAVRLVNAAVSLGRALAEFASLKEE